MRAIKYFFSEAAASLWRGRRAAVLAILTIAAGLFVLGFFLALNSNLQRVVSRWSESAELAVYLKDEVSDEQLASIGEMIDRSGLSAHREYVPKAKALERFKQDFPDLAGTAERLDRNPLPASIDVQLKPEVRDAGGAIDGLATALTNMPGTADVRYDRRWLARLNTLVRGVQGIAVLIVVMLAIASALTVANVVRLAASARRDEIEIMQLVGAPFPFVRGPFVVEGILQGGIGAILAIVLLWAMFGAARARYGGAVAEIFGLGTITFLPVQVWLTIVLGGMLLGCIGGYVVARNVR